MIRTRGKSIGLGFQNLVTGRRRGLGFRDLEAFNYAMLAKQVWRPIQDETSLVAHVLKSRYYPTGDILSAGIGVRPSYTWRSWYWVKDDIMKGSRWIVGDGNSLNIRTSCWLPRSTSFRSICMGQFVNSASLVADFIYKEAG